MMNLAKPMRVSIAMLAVAAVLLGCGEKWPPAQVAVVKLQPERYGEFVGAMDVAVQQHGFPRWRGCCTQMAGRVAEQLLDLATFSANYFGKRINWGLSAGCAVFPSDGKDGPGLMKSADTALNELKAAGRGGLRLFDTRMVKEEERARAQRSIAKRIVDEDRVEPHYQPKVRLDDNSLVAYGYAAKSGHWQRSGNTEQVAIESAAKEVPCGWPDFVSLVCPSMSPLGTDFPCRQGGSVSIKSRPYKRFWYSLFCLLL